MKHSMFLLVLATFILTSCQKELNFPPGEDHNYLEKMVFYSPGFTDSTIWSFTYDNAKRLTGVLQKQHLSGEVRLDGQYLYRGKDSVPYKYIQKQPDINSETIHFYTYKNGFIIKDSAFAVFTGGQNKIVTTYDSLVNGRYQLRRETTDMATGSATIFRVTYAHTVVNNSITNIHDTTFRDNGVWHYMTTTTINFDNEKSPFKKWSIWFNGYYSQLFCELRNDAWPGNHNNAVLFSDRTLYNGGRPGTTVIRYTYTYNEEGYPASRTNDLDAAVIAFRYKKLGR